MEHYTLRVDLRAIGAQQAGQYGELIHTADIDSLTEHLCDAFEAHLGQGTAPLREMITHLLASLRTDGLTEGSSIKTTFGRPSRPTVFFTVIRHADILTDQPATV